MTASTIWRLCMYVLMRVFENMFGACMHIVKAYIHTRVDKTLI